MSCVEGEQHQTDARCVNHHAGAWSGNGVRAGACDG